MTFESAPNRGNLWPALAISLVLHGLALWSVHPEMPVGEVARRLEATLRPAPVPLVPALPAPEPKPAAPQRKEVPAQPEILAAPKSPIAVPREPSPKPVSDSTPEAVRRSATDTPPSPVPPPVEASRGADVPSSAPTASIEGVQVDGIRQYRLSLAAQARKFKRYPARAMEAGMSGTTEVRVVVAPSGFPQDVSMAKTSGYDLLDQAALDMVRKAVPRTAIPEPLRGRSFVVSLPVVFDLAAE